MKTTGIQIKLPDEKIAVPKNQLNTEGIFIDELSDYIIQHLYLDYATCYFWQISKHICSGGSRALQIR